MIVFKNWASKNGKEHTKVGLCIFCLMSISIGLKIASKVLNIKHFSGQLIINFKKRVGESHVLLHNLRVELFKCKHKMAFAGG